MSDPMLFTALNRRSFATMAFALSSAAVAGATLTPDRAMADTSQGDAWRGVPEMSVAVRSLGVPVKELRMNVSATGYLPDGSPVLYVQGGSPQNAVQFAALDPITGKQLRHHAIEELDDSLSMIRAGDGRVYIPGWGPEALLFRYDPSDDSMTNLGHAVAGESHICRIIEAADGTIHGGTFPNGHAFSFDPTTDTFTDYGQVDPGEYYARAVAYDEQGNLYIGTEGTARMIKLNLATGARTEIPQPPTMKATDFRISLMAWRGGLVMAYYGGSLEWHVYDPRTQQWVAHLPKSAPSMPTELDESGLLYFSDNVVNRLRTFNPATLEVGDAGWSRTVNYYLGGGGMGLLDLKHPNYPGQSVVGMGRRGELWRFNIETGHGHVMTNAEMPLTPVTVRAFGRGPDGKVYVGLSFNNGNLVTYHPPTDDLHVQSTGGIASQIHQYLTADGVIYMGTYTGAVLRRLNPALPLGTGNPGIVFNLNDLNQDRIFGLTKAGDRIAAGTLGKRGHASGRLLFHTPSTGVVVDHGEVLPGHQLVAMAVVDHLLFIGTSVNTPGADPIAPEAQIVAWDLRTDTIAWRHVPVQGLQTISALVPTSGGHLWALTNAGTIFRFDPKKRQVLQETHVAGSGGNHGYPKLTQGVDGLVYGSTGSGVIFALNPNSGGYRTLTTGNYVLPHSDGRLYFARGPEVFQATLTRIE
ncbi:hypothetical protein ACQCX5_10970 [Propionibacteriaceae bacterium G57]|uniref:hypothetical protein n=1 Tax=Aestuariimicrobium sp. G57 TaxID=3418485 RepID=UPI003DA72C37